MDIYALHAFIAVARYRSFSVASEHLFVTQPAISKRVAALETELGTQLFNRVARQISLTEAGKQLLPKAQELVDQAEELQRFANNLNKKIRGNLSIALSHHIGLHRMPPILREFNTRYPQVDLDIRFADSDQALRAVVQGDIEFAAITLPQSLPDNLAREVVWIDSLAVMCSVDHPLAKSANIDMSMLAEFPAVLTKQDTETHQIILREFQQGDLDLQVQMETNNLETLKMLVSASIGWSLLPISLLDSSLQQIETGQSFKRELGMVMHQKRSLSNAAMAFSDMVRESGGNH